MKIEAGSCVHSFYYLSGEIVNDAEWIYLNQHTKQLQQSVLKRSLEFNTFLSIILCSVVCVFLPQPIQLYAANKIQFFSHFNTSSFIFFLFIFSSVQPLKCYCLKKIKLLSDPHQPSVAQRKYIKIETNSKW